MGSVLRVTLTVLLAVALSAFMGGVVVFTYDRIDRSGPPGSDLYFTTSLTIGLFVTVLPAFVSGVLIGLLKLRPLKGMLVGVALHILPVVIILGWVLVTEKNISLKEVGDGGPFTIWTMLLLPVGAITGFICGLLSPKQKLLS